MSFKRNVFEDMKEESSRWVALSVLCSILGIFSICLIAAVNPNKMLGVAAIFCGLFTFCFGMTIGLMRAEKLLKDHMNEFRRDE